MLGNIPIQLLTNIKINKVKMKGKYFCPSFSPNVLTVISSK